MHKVLSKKDIDILEMRGYWQASSYLHRIIKRLMRKGAPLELKYIKNAHYIIFTTANQEDMAGKYRKNNPEVKKINGNLLAISHWQNIPNAMSELDVELRERTKNLREPKTARDLKEIIFVAAWISHRLACIHPFENGNGRASRLLLEMIFVRFGLPPLAIKDPKPRYLRAMCQADYGDFSLLESLIIRGLMDAEKIRIKQSEPLKRRRVFNKKR